MGYRAGIDLGTTFSAAAIWRDGDARPEVVTLGSRGAAIPTVVYVDPDGTVLVGEAAEARAATDPGRVAREFKRRLGDPTPVLLGGSPWSPEALLAAVLGHVVGRISAQEGGPPSALTLTFPANWGPYKVEQFRQVPTLANLPFPTDFATEPDAAATHYASNARTPAGAVVAVYDLGGGTFDATVLRVGDDGRPIPLGTAEGIDRLGGVDIDAAVLEHVRASVPHLFDGLDADDPLVASSLAELRAACQRAKEVLSEDTHATVVVALPTGAAQVRITRAELEDAIRRQVDLTVVALQRAMGSAGVTPGEVHAVLLVGGASRMPIVAQSVSAALGRPTAVDANPKHATALGAALGPAPAAAPTPTPQPQPGHDAGVAPPARPAGGPPAAEPPQPRPGRRRRRALAAGAAAAVVAAVAAGALVLSPDGSDDEVGVVATVAGTGEAGDTGDHDAAVDARLDEPASLAFDRDGRLLIADRANHRIRALLVDGTITPILEDVSVQIGGDVGVAIDQRPLVDPTSVTAHEDGSIWFADSGCYVGATSDDLAFVVAGTYPDEDFNCEGPQPTTPVATAALADGRVLVVDGITGVLWVADPEDATVTQFDDQEFPVPTALAVHPDGRILVAVDGGSRVVALDPDGDVRDVAGAGFDEDADLGDGGPATDAVLEAVEAIAVHPDGRILLADAGSHRIRAVDEDGTITTIAGTGTGGYNGDGQAATSTQLNRPSGIAVDAEGRIYVADSGNNRIRTIG